MNTMMIVGVAACACVVVVVCVLVVLLLNNKGGGAYAGLPSQPPTYANAETQELANGIFATTSDCWEFNRLVRVTTMEKLVTPFDAFVTQWKAANPGKPFPKSTSSLRTPAGKTFVASYGRAVYDFLQAASTIQCDANATYQDNAGTTRKVADFVSALKTMSTYTPAQLDVLINRFVYPAIARLR